MSFDVFISHSSKDKPVAEALRQHLEDKGVSCWIDEEQIEIGEDWTEAIGRALRNVHVMILIYSLNAMESENVKDELSIAAKRKLAIIPIRIDDIEPNEFFEVRLSRYNWIDVFEKQQEKLREIAESVCKRVEKLRSSATEVNIASPNNISNLSGAGTGQQADKPKAEVLRPTDEMSKEKTYLDILTMAYSDGVVSPQERDFLTQKANELGITLERANELEEQVKKQSGASIITPTANQAQNETASDGDVDWPNSGLTFVRAIRESLDISKLPFKPCAVSDDKEIEEDWEIDWEISDKYYFAVWLTGKHKDTIGVYWGFYNDTKRDPEFRKTIEELLNQNEYILIDGAKYSRNNSAKDCLGIETSERKLIAEINNPDFVKHAIDKLLSFSNKSWLVIKKNLVKG